MSSDCPSGIRHVGGAKLNQALVRNVRTWPAMPREKAQAAPTARPKVPMRRRGADCPVVVMKRGNARGAKGAGHQRWIGSTGNGKEPDNQRKAAAFAWWQEPDSGIFGHSEICCRRGKFMHALIETPNHLWTRSRVVKALCCLAAVLLLFCTPAHTLDDTDAIPGALNRTYNEWMSKNNLAAGSLATMKNGVIVRSFGYGDLQASQ